MITQDFERTLAVVSEVTEIDKEQILSSCRQMEYVEARVLFVKALNEQGYHYIAIAKKMGRAVSSIKALLDNFQQRSEGNIIFKKLHSEIKRKLSDNSTITDFKAVKQ